MTIYNISQRAVDSWWLALIIRNPPETVPYRGARATVWARTHLSQPHILAGIGGRGASVPLSESLPSPAGKNMVYRGDSGEDHRLDTQSTQHRPGTHQVLASSDLKFLMLKSGNRQSWRLFTRTGPLSFPLLPFWEVRHLQFFFLIFLKDSCSLTMLKDWETHSKNSIMFSNLSLLK